MPSPKRRRSSRRLTFYPTKGLAPFAGREIEFAPSTWAPMQMAGRVIGTALYLMQHGPVIKDGDTLGASERERLNVRVFQDSNEFVLMRAL